MTTGKLDFHKQILECVLGGISAIDIPRLEIFDLEGALQFSRTYGFNLEEPSQLEKLWSLHRRAVDLIKHELLEDDESIPEELTDPEQLVNPAHLLIFASSKDPKDREKQKWACALLRVIHVFAHVENDVFFEFAEPIQEQVLKVFRAHLREDPVLGPILGVSSEKEQIFLKRFDVKPFKTHKSSVIKLLTKSQAVALTLTDKMGLRFVTKDIWDTFKVVRYLVQEHLVSFPNIMPDQSKNTLYPLNLFFEVMKSLDPMSTEKEIVEALNSKLEASTDRAQYLEKQNDFSGSEYRAFKFIARQLIQLKIADKTSRFFFPYEIQVVDYDAYVQSLSGPSSHQEYKKRQKLAARLRVLKS
jgi:uncharacterized protein (TIGR04562 family)